jgi:hypothetical protein
MDVSNNIKTMMYDFKMFMFFGLFIQIGFCIWALVESAYIQEDAKKMKSSTVTHDKDSVNLIHMYAMATMGIQIATIVVWGIMTLYFCSCLQGPCDCIRGDKNYKNLRGGEYLSIIVLAALAFCAQFINFGIALPLYDVCKIVHSSMSTGVTTTTPDMAMRLRLALGLIIVTKLILLTVGHKKAIEISRRKDDKASTANLMDGSVKA